MPKQDDFDHFTVFGSTAVPNSPVVPPETLDKIREQFPATNYSADDGYPTPEQIKAMAEEIVYRGGKKLEEIHKAAAVEFVDNVSIPPETIAKIKEQLDNSVRKLEAGTAVKFDADKLDWSLLPWDTLEEIIKVLQFGAGKYSPWNWAEGDGFKYNRLFNSSMRHFIAWFWRREDKDPETGLSHIAHLGCNVLFLLHYILNGNKFKNNDNRPDLSQTK